MQCSNVESTTPLIKVDSSDSWANVVVDCAEKETNLSLALHKMSQQVTVLLTTLELTQMAGELLPEDLITMLENAIQLRDSIRTLRAINNSTEVPSHFALLNQ